MSAADRCVSRARLLVPRLFSQSMPAATAVWNGSTDTTWVTAGNWTPGVIPGTGDTAVFPTRATGSGLAWVTSTDAAGFYITVGAVPEPGRSLLLFGALVVLVLRRRRA